MKRGRRTDLHAPLLPDEVDDVAHVVHLHVRDRVLLQDALVEGARQEEEHHQAEEDEDGQGDPEGPVWESSEILYTYCIFSDCSKRSYFRQNRGN
ncbi:hypothetical protein AVEN_52022-1 [Araneus ventricosus]|uniref:Uncharacterized protein n=1 Tax=Araneus ventricosus TaxID=182803 RepID=A0A4Y2CER8_ARAVE|nr:hypothetical protein AVEN_52022-1 [Araneus ventricosus]